MVDTRVDEGQLDVNVQQQIDGPGVPGRRVVPPGTALQAGGISALAHSLHVMSLAMDELRARLGAQLELNAVDVSALIEIYNRPDIRPTDLGRAIHMRSAGLTALADRLIKGGYVRRSPDPNDRRGNRLRLSPAGLHAAGWIFDTASAALEGAQLGDADSLSATLMGLAEALDATPIPQPSPPAGQHGRSTPRGMS